MRIRHCNFNSLLLNINGRDFSSFYGIAHRKVKFIVNMSSTWHTKELFVMPFLAYYANFLFSFTNERRDKCLLNVSALEFALLD